MSLLLALQAPPVPVAVGQAVDAGTAQPITPVVSRRYITVGQAAETSTATAVAPVVSRRYRAVGQAAETNVATAVAPVRTRRYRAVGQAVETSTATAVAPVVTRRYRTVGQAVETNVALTVRVPRFLAVGQAAGTEAALPVTARRRRSVPVGRAGDTHTAHSVRKFKGAVPSSSAFGSATDSNSYSHAGVSVQAGDTLLLWAVSRMTSGGPVATPSAFVDDGVVTHLHTVTHEQVRHDLWSWRPATTRASATITFLWGQTVHSKVTGFINYGRKLHATNPFPQVKSFTNGGVAANGASLTFDAALRYGSQVAYFVTTNTNAGGIPPVTPETGAASFVEAQEGTVTVAPLLRWAYGTRGYGSQSVTLSTFGTTATFALMAVEVARYDLVGTALETDVAQPVTPAGNDTVPPTPNITAVTASTISRVTGFDTTDITFEANEAFVEYQLRIVPNGSSDRTAGTLVEQATVTSRTTHSTTVTDDELVAAIGASVDGSYVIKAFVKDAAGNWSA